MASERVAVVDDDNRFLRWAERREVHALRLPHRSVQVLLFDSKGRLIVQRRDRQKLTYPGHWDISASGHVEECDYPDPAHPDADLDAVYDAVAARELEEELGVRAALERLGTFAPEPGVHYEHFVLYRARSDGPYVPQPGEVDAVRALTPAELGALESSPAEPLTASLLWIVHWARRRGLW
jgi:isopentenyl-diphosphate Delta-isomerase